MNDLPVVRSPWRILILVLGFTFLYAPMLMLVIYSFNSSKLVTVWAGWSTRWYSELFHDDAMMSAVGLSLTIAACAATAAAIENLTFATDFSDKLHPGFLLCDADIRVITVTKNVDIKVFGIPGGFY